MRHLPRLVRSHVGAAVASAVAVVALAGGGIAYAVTASGSPASSSSSATTPATAAPPSSRTGQAGGARGTGAARARHPGVRGTVTAVNGGTWTVKTARGVSITVTVTPRTVFGTKKVPGSASSFPVGTVVRVEGQRTGTTITATRILAPKAAGGSSTSTTVAS